MRTSSKSDPCSPNEHVDTAIESFGILVNAKVLDGTQKAGGKKYKFNLEDEFTGEVISGAYDPNATTVYRDLRGIMTHELGHAFQLRHTNNPGDLMSTGRISENKLQRKLSDNDILGANHVRLLSLKGACGFEPMTPYVCTTGPAELNSVGNMVAIVPNPNIGVFSIESSYFNKNCTLEITKWYILCNFLLCRW